MAKSLHFTRSIISGLAGVVLLNACNLQQVQKPKDPGERDKTQDSSNSVLKWEKHGQIQSGYMTQPYNKVENVNANPALFCFDNTLSSCVTAQGDVGNRVAANPVPVQGFQLAALQNADSGTAAHGAGWFVTAEPRVSKSTGAFSFVGRQIRKFTGTGGWTVASQVPLDECNPSQGDAVGVLAGATGSEKILTGIQAFSDALYPAGMTVYNGTLNGYSRLGAYLRAGKIFYAGFVPKDGTAEAPFQFSIIPNLTGLSVDADNFAQMSEFGETSVDEGTNLFTLPHYGLVPADQAELDKQPELNSKWYSHVIIGYCYKGTRTGEKVLGTSFTVNRPVLFGVTSRMYRPVMQKK